MIDQYAAKLGEGRDALAAREGSAAGRPTSLKPPPGTRPVRPEATRRTRRRSTRRSRRSTRRLTTRATRRRTRRQDHRRARRPLPQPREGEGAAPAPRTPFPQPSPPPATLVFHPPRPSPRRRCAASSTRSAYPPSSSTTRQDRRPGRRRPRAVHGVRGEGAPRLVPHGLAQFAADRQARPLGALLPADGVRVAAVRLALRLRRHPQRQRPLLVHGGHPAAHVRDRLPRLAGHARRVPLRRQGPNLPPVEGCPANNNPGHWSVGTPCTYIPPPSAAARTRPATRTGRPATGIFGTDDFEHRRHLRPDDV